MSEKLSVKKRSGNYQGKKLSDIGLGYVYSEKTPSFVKVGPHQIPMQDMLGMLKCEDPESFNKAVDNLK